MAKARLGESVLTDTFQPVKDFEAALCAYTGAPYAVAVHRCTNALTMCVEYMRAVKITIPKRTYVEVPQAIVRGGARVLFEELEWRGAYQLRPYPIWDSARRFRAGMYRELTGFVCLSFHRSKILGHTEGGAILTYSLQAATWFRLARFGGRAEGVAPKDDNFTMIGWPCYMIPEVASALLQRLVRLPKHNPDLPNDDYPDLSQRNWNGMWEQQKNG